MLEGRTVEVTEAAGEKKAAKKALGAADPESVFSGQILPAQFFRNFLKAQSVCCVCPSRNYNLRIVMTPCLPHLHLVVKMRCDLAAAQGELAKACLSERVPFYGFTLSEAHSRHLEILLTDYVLEQMSTEGSTFYRSEVASKADDRKRTAEEDKKPVPKKKAKAKSKNNKPETDAVGENQDDNAAEGEEATGSPLPW